MSLKNRIILFFVVLILPLIFVWSFQKKYISYEGQALGTTFLIKCYSPIWISKLRIISEVNKSFDDMNSIFSTWIDNSELSLINSNSQLNPIRLSDELYNVLLLSKKLNDLSAGAFDPTVKPVVDLWGFNNKNSYYKIPSDEKLNVVSSYVGFEKVILGNKELTKKHSDINIDLSSVAKGYTVDHLGKIFDRLKIKNYMIELGGEVVVKTPKNKPNKVWKLGIISPNYNYSNQELHITLNLKNNALATSGDYRNYFTKNNRTYSHIFNPQLGKPVSTNIASVSVVADNCALADGLATSIMVLGKERGIALIEALEDVEAMIIERTTFDDFVTYYSSDFKKFLDN